MTMPNPSQEPPAQIKAWNWDLKDMDDVCTLNTNYLKEIDIICTFKIKIESQNLEHGCIEDQWPYPNQDQDVKL